jgi:hypothetical protein
VVVAKGAGVVSAELTPAILADVRAWAISQVEQLRALARAVSARLGGGDEIRATCPVDDWTFAPRYTDGVCPLCGYQPPGVDATAWPEPIDWFWPVFGTLVVASLGMGVLVIVAYNRF